MNLRTARVSVAASLLLRGLPLACVLITIVFCCCSQLSAENRGKPGYVECKEPVDFVALFDPATLATVRHLACGETVSILGENSGQLAKVRTTTGTEGFVNSSLLHEGSHPMPQALMDFLANGYRNMCTKKDKDPSPACLDNYINSLKFREIQFLAGQSPKDAVSGFLVEVNRNGCEASAKCDVIYVAPQLGTSLARVDPENPPGLEGLAAIVSIDKAKRGETGWRIVLEFDGTLDSVAGGSDNVQIGAWDSVLGLKVNGRDYMYHVASQMYFDVVAAQEAQKQREEQAEKEQERKQEIQLAAFKKLGLHSGQSQAQVKNILAALGFRNHTNWTSDQRIWACGTDGWKDGYFYTGCLASREGKDRILAVFEIARRVRDSDTGAIHEVKTGRLFMVKYGLGPTDAETEIPMLIVGGADDKATVAQHRLIYAKF